MSASPPKQSGGPPGYLLVLAGVSLLVFLFALAIGLVAFDLVDLGDDDSAPSPTIGQDGQSLQPSGFTVRDSRWIENRREMDVDVAVTNTGDKPLENTTMIVQCLDGGFTSDKMLIVSIQPNQTLHVQLMLTGTGEPACADPVIDFDTP